MNANEYEALAERKRVFARRALIGCALAVLLGAVGFWGVNVWVDEATDAYIAADAAKLPDADAILVLGARVYGDGAVSPMLHDRLAEGLALYRAGKAPRFVVSGDHGTIEYDEVNAMKRFLEERGVPPEHIFTDHAGFSTYESLYRARDVFGAKRLIVVTQGYHLKRAVYVGRRLGMDVYGVPSDPRAYPGMARFEAREKLARAKDFVFVHWLRPKPTYLGEPFPLTGDGRATHDGSDGPEGEGGS